MRHNIAAQVGALLGQSSSVRIPYRWFTAIPNHTALVVLADILSAYAGDGIERLWDDDELILEYKLMAKRLGISDRTISRAVDVLEKRGAIHAKRRDRKPRGKVVRNIVGVVPNMEVVAKFSEVKLGDNLSAREPGAAVPPKGSRSPLATTLPTAEPLPLTPPQESLVRAYEDYFKQNVGERYRTSPEQHLADLRAIASVTIPKARGAGREYMVWARQYLEALTARAENEHGEASEAAFDLQGNVTGRFSIESFIAWAKTNERLPNRLARRSFR